MVGNTYSFILNLRALLVAVRCENFPGCRFLIVVRLRDHKGSLGLYYYLLWFVRDFTT